MPRQNIYAERSPNTARLSGSKNKMLHRGCLMVYIDSQPHPSVLYFDPSKYYECLKKCAKNDVGDLSIQVYTDLPHQYVAVTKYLY